MISSSEVPPDSSYDPPHQPDDAASVSTKLKKFIFHAFARLIKHFLCAIGFAALLFAVVKVFSWFTIWNLPKGKRYILEPRGWGLLYSLCVDVIGMTFFLLLNTACAAFIRKSIGCVLRVFMLSIFVGFLTFLQCSKYIAVVQTPDSFTFYRRFPFGQMTILNRDITEIETQDTGAVKSLTLRVKEFDLELEPVFDCDAVGQKTLTDLVVAMRNTKR